MASSSSQPSKSLPANPPKVSSEDIISQKVSQDNIGKIVHDY